VLVLPPLFWGKSLLFNRKANRRGVQNPFLGLQLPRYKLSESRFTRFSYHILLLRGFHALSCPSNPSDFLGHRCIALILFLYPRMKMVGKPGRGKHPCNNNILWLLADFQTNEQQFLPRTNTPHTHTQKSYCKSFPSSFCSF